MFKSARLKIERADHHIRDLERQIGLYSDQSKSYSVEIEPHEGGGSYLRISHGQNLPDGIALVIGDAANNLWTALDHLAWELVGPSGQNKHLHFPSGDNRINFEATCRGIKAPSDTVRDVLVASEVFPGGKGDALYLLKALNNADKHAIATPVSRNTYISRLEIWNNGKLETVGENSTYANVGNRTSFFLRPGRTVKLDDDVKITVDVCFGKIRRLENQSVLPTMVQFRHVVAHALDTIERAIS